MTVLGVRLSEMPQKQRYESLGIHLEEVKAELLAVNNLALENKPEDMVITSQILLW